MTTTPRPAVFLDRDGTLTVEKEYWYKQADLEFVPGAVEAVRLFNQAGFLVIIVTNQSGVARGMFGEDDVLNLHKYMEKQLELQGAYVNCIYYCPHHPDGVGDYKKSCECRKPNTAMFKKACHEFLINTQHSWMIGDKVIDMDFARNCGLQAVLVQTGYGRETEVELAGQTDIVVKKDLLAAARKIVTNTYETPHRLI